ncbi:hypothetical protein PV-S19_0149 [Pacmanvirus S19]|nr:hypothetical protein PV-S19_0149 [Pacmanvirus S19]
MTHWDNSLGMSLIEEISFEMMGRITSWYGKCKCHCGCSVMHNATGDWVGKVPISVKYCVACLLLHDKKN